MSTNLADLIGKPFVDGGRGPDGYDCYGLAREIWHRMTGNELPDYKISALDFNRINGQIMDESPQWKEIDQPLAPCIVLMHFNSTFCNHIGVYIGGGFFMHAREGVGVVRESITSPVWHHRIEGFYIPKG